MSAPGQETIDGALVITGNCSDGNGGDGGVDGCDGVFHPDYPLPTIEEHAAEMWENSYLPAVGPTPDGPTAINVFRKTTGILNELEKAHITNSSTEPSRSCRARSTLSRRSRSVSRRSRLRPSSLSTLISGRSKSPAGTRLLLFRNLEDLRKAE